MTAPPARPRAAILGDETAKAAELCGLWLRVAPEVQERTGKMFYEVRGHWAHPEVVEIFDSAFAEYNSDFEERAAGPTRSWRGSPRRWRPACPPRPSAGTSTPG